MTAPTLLRLAFDSGWSHGDPGDGRLRFDNPKIAKAANLCINARDAQEALLDELIPSWRIGDVVVIERPGAERNRVVVWIIGPIVHMGPFYRIPVIVRTVNGAFAAHDELVLHHHRNVTEVDDNVAAAPEADRLPNSVTEQTPKTEFGRVSAPAPSAAALPPIAPMALTPAHQENIANSMALTPVAPAISQVAPANSPIAPSEIAAELDKLRADNTALHDLLAGLLNDSTELYTVEHA